MLYFSSCFYCYNTWVFYYFTFLTFLILPWTVHIISTSFTHSHSHVSVWLFAFSHRILCIASRSEWVSEYKYLTHLIFLDSPFTEKTRDGGCGPWTGAESLWVKDLVVAVRTVIMCVLVLAWRWHWHYRASLIFSHIFAKTAPNEIRWWRWMTGCRLRSCCLHY